MVHLLTETCSKTIPFIRKQKPKRLELENYVVLRKREMCLQLMITCINPR